MPKFSKRFPNIGTLLVLFKELAIFRNLDTIAARDQRRKHGNEGKSSAVDAQGPGL
jgi:hypothetical protein